MHNVKTLFMTLLTFVFIVGCTSKKPDGDTFVYCSEASPSAFNPQITTDGTSSNASAKTVYDTLVKFKYGETELTPGLASSWEVSDDGLTFTFNLRRGVWFHHTNYFKPRREFNADDVLFSFNRQRLPNHPFHRIGGGNYDYWNGMEMSRLIKNIEKVDDYTVRISLNEPNAPFLANLAMGFSSILSKEYADMLQKQNRMQDIDHLPIGTGPFIFKKYVKDSLIRYKSNEKYFLGAPKIQNLVFSITPDQSVRYQKLKTNECHLIIDPAPQDLKAMEKNESLIVLKKPGLNVGYVAMNTQKAPFDNILVRKAVHHALNRKAYIQAIYLGHGVVASNPLPPTIWSYHQGLVDYQYDVTKAKEIMKEAGFPEGLSEPIELWTLPVSRPYNPNGKKMGEMIQADLAKIGIKVKLVSFDWGTYLDKAKKGEHQMIQLGWTGDNGDPDNFLSVLLGCPGVSSGSNVARWCNDEFDKLTKLAKATLAKTERSTLYKKAQEIFKSEAPWVPIAHSIVHRGLSKKVTGFKIDPFGHDIFTFVELKK